MSLDKHGAVGILTIFIEKLSTWICFTVQSKIPKFVCIRELETHPNFFKFLPQEPNKTLNFSDLFVHKKNYIYNAKGCEMKS